MINLKSIPDFIQKEELSFTSTVDYGKLMFEEKKTIPRLIVNSSEFPDVMLKGYFIHLQFNSEDYDEKIQTLEHELQEALSQSMFPEKTKQEFTDQINEIVAERTKAIDENPDMSFNAEIEKFERKFSNGKKIYQLQLIIDEKTAIMMVSTKSEFTKYDAHFIVPSDDQEATKVDLFIG